MKFGITGNLQKPELPHVVEQLIRRFSSEHVRFVLHDALFRQLRQSLDRSLLKSVNSVSEKKLATSCDILISLGGDGTILRTARIVGEHGTPILGINIGKLGFLAEVSLDGLDGCIDEILRSDYRVEDRMMLQANSRKLRRDYFALNDIVMDLSTSARMISIETYVDGAYLSTFTGDGVIVATPTGSTGYALSNGGPIVTPTSHTIMISPICPHTLTARTVILPEESIVQLRVESAPGKVHVTADGQPESLITPPVEVVVRKAPFVTRLVKRKNQTYYDVLRKKLHWGRDLRVRMDNKN